MNQFFKVFTLLFLSLLAISCNKSDDAVTATPPNAFADQAPVDDAKILDFMDKYSMVKDADNNVTFTLIPSPNTANLQKIKDEYATQLKTKLVKVGDVEHKVYYISFSDGDLTKKPTIVDSIYVAYRGRLLDNTTFDANERIPVWFVTNGVIQGWREIFTQFGPAPTAPTDNGDGTYSFNGYGAGVMFLPSALGYYNATQSTIPAYSPLIFNFKLMAVNYVDNDSDGIDSKYEGWDPITNTYIQDTDGDGTLDLLDFDDDQDGFLTKYEIKNPAGGYYSFANIPLCTDGKKKHLSSQCH